MQTLKVTPYKFNPDEPGTLSYYSIHSLLKDNTGALWVGTWKGLNYYSPVRTQFYRITPREFTGLLGMGKEDSDGNIWFATEGAGLFAIIRIRKASNFILKSLLTKTITIQISLNHYL